MPRPPRPLAAALLAAALAAPLAAVDWIVTRYDDPVPDGCLADDCSLREAVIAANSTPAANRVLLSAGTYELTLDGAGENAAASGDLDFFEQLELIGPGATMTVIDASQLDDSIVQASDSGSVHLFRGITFRGGPGSGLVLARGISTIEACEFRDLGDATADVAVSASIFADVTILGSTFAGNAGRGLSIGQSTAVVANSTFTGNGDDEIVVISGASFTCTNCTIADADDDGELAISTSTVTLADTVIEGDCVLNVGAIVVSNGGNLESPGDGCGLDAASDQHTVADAGLGALGDHGGPTRTLELESDSPAVDAAVGAPCPDEDQRGATRPLDGPDGDADAECDAGAVELAADRPPTPIFHDDFEQGHPGAWSDSLGAEV